jgi:hypothetical protein
MPIEQGAAKTVPECAPGGVKVSAGASPATLTVNDTTTSAGVQVVVSITGTSFTVTPGRSSGQFGRRIGGPVGHVGNLQQYLSYDGTCTGPESCLRTAVSGTTNVEAELACQTLSSPVWFPMTQIWPTAPSNLWVCF